MEIGDLRKRTRRPINWIKMAPEITHPRMSDGETSCPFPVARLFLIEEQASLNPQPIVCPRAPFASEFSSPITRSEPRIRRLVNRHRGTSFAPLSNDSESDRWKLVRPAKVRKLLGRVMCHRLLSRGCSERWHDVFRRAAGKQGTRRRWKTIRGWEKADARSREKRVELFS